MDAEISEKWLYYKELNALKEPYAQRRGYEYLDTVGAGLTTAFEPEEEPDTAHYDSNCIVRLGEMFAEKLVL